MAPAKVMLIRHAEKPDGTGNVMGVSKSQARPQAAFRTRLAAGWSARTLLCSGRW